jgi:hypothetical protein
VACVMHAHSPKNLDCLKIVRYACIAVFTMVYTIGNSFKHVFYGCCEFSKESSG